MSQLKTVFEQFASFGGKASTEMTSVAFAKMCKDCKVVDKKLTTVDVDIVFKKVCAKGERKIKFEEFQEALKQLASIKYKNDPERDSKLEELIATGKPQKDATEADTDEIVSKLTDTSLYTGTHKEKFDGEGKGKGSKEAKTGELSDVVARKSGTAPADRKKQAKGTPAPKGKNEEAVKKPAAKKDAGSAKPTAAKGKGKGKAGQ